VRAYLWQGELAIRLTPEEALGFVSVVQDLSEIEYRGEQRRTVHWLKSALPGVAKRLRTRLDPNPHAVAKKEDAAREEDERRAAHGRHQAG